jgi:DNA-binding NarL/FixJ family response regulator
VNEIRVLIVEDEPVIATNLSMYLNNNDFSVSGIAYDFDEAVAQLRQNTPDAAILDIGMELNDDGIHLAELINSKYKIPFIFVTSYADKETLQKAKRVEPSGYIVKPFNEKTLLASLEIAISNFANKNNRTAPELNLQKLNRHLLSPLTERELEVLQNIYIGKTNNQIAGDMFLSVNTIKAHIKSSYLKLDTSSRATTINRLRDLMIK